jgi:hypothetical protein
MSQRLELSSYSVPRVSENGWYEIKKEGNQNIRYDLKTNEIYFDRDSIFSLLIVPFTVGKFEDEDKYLLKVERNACKIYHQYNKYIDRELKWRLEKNFTI